MKMPVPLISYLTPVLDDRGRASDLVPEPGPVSRAARGPRCRHPAVRAVHGRPRRVRRLHRVSRGAPGFHQGVVGKVKHECTQHSAMEHGDASVTSWVAQVSKCDLMHGKCSSSYWVPGNMGMQH